MCPNANDEQIRNEFNEVVTALGGRPLTVEEFKSKELRASRTGIDAAAMDAAYDFWDLNNDNPIDKTPNGKESILFKTLYKHYGDRQKAIRAKANTYSKNFKNWFGDWINDPVNASKVVDENGEPLVVYHLSNASGFSVFNLDESTKDRDHLNSYAFHFGTKKAAEEVEVLGEKGELFKVFLSIKKPVKLHDDIQASAYATITDFFSFYAEKRYGKILSKTLFDKARSIVTDYNSSPEEKRKIMEEVFDYMGFDGIFYKNEVEDVGSTSYSILNPNKIKHINNNGNFSTVDDNIYHNLKPNKDPYNFLKKAGLVRDRYGFHFIPKYLYPTELLKNKLFFEIQQLSEANGYHIDFYENPNSTSIILTEQELYDKLDKDESDEVNEIIDFLKARFPKLRIEYVEASEAAVDQNAYVIDNVVYLVKGRFNRTNTIEEMLHPFINTLYKYNRELFDALYELASVEYPKLRREIYNTYVKPGMKESDRRQELVTQALSRELNKEFKEGKVSTFRQLINGFVEWLKGLFISFTDNFAGINHIDSTKLPKMTLEELSKLLHTSDTEFYTEFSGKFNSLSTSEVEKTNEKIKKGIKQRLAAIQRYQTKNIKTIQETQRLIDKLNELDSVEGVIEFVNYVRDNIAEAFKFLNRDVDDINSTQIVQLKRDYLGFFIPMMKDIQYILDTTSELKGIPDYEMFRDTVDNIVNGQSTLINKYNNILKSKTHNLLRQYAENAGSLTVDQMMDWLQDPNKDLGWLETWLGLNSSTGNEVIRIITDILNNQINTTKRNTYNKGIELVNLLKKAKEANKGVDVMSLLLEKDKDGQTTGYFTRDLNYGRFYQELQKEYDKIAEDMKLEKDSSGEYIFESKEQERQFRQRRIKAQLKHGNLKYTKEYYDEKAKLPIEAQDALDYINSELDYFITTLTENGVIRWDKLTPEKKAQLDNLNRRKAELYSEFHADGEAKSGTDLLIAQSLIKMKKALSGKVKYKTNYDKWNKAAKAIIDKYGAKSEEYKKWYMNSTQEVFTDEFYEILDKISATKSPYIQELYDKRNRLLNMYRDQGSRAIEMPIPDEIKAQIIELDKEIAKKKGKVIMSSEDTRFSDIADIRKTEQYYEDEKSARAEGRYEEWYHKNHYEVDGHLRVASYYTYMVPNNSKHITRIPNSYYSQVDQSSDWVNPDYDLDGEYVQPKRSLYDNSKAFDAIQNNPTVKALYDALIESMTNSNGKIAFAQNQNPYRLPQISGRMMATIARSDDKWEALKYTVADQFRIKDDDTQYVNDFEYRPDGSQIKLIPTRFMRMLDDPKMITSDVVGSVILYFEMAENYKNMSAVQSDLEMVLYRLEQLDVKSGLKVRSGKESRIYQKAVTLLDMALYGKKKELIKVGKYNLSKGLNKIYNYISLSNLSYNIWAMTANYVTGLGTLDIESIAGKYFDTSDIAFAKKEFLQRFGHLSANIGNVNDKDKLVMMMQMNQVTRSNQETFDRLDQSSALRAINQHFWYNGYTAGDFTIKSQLLLAVYHSYKYIDGEYITKKQYIDKYYPTDRKAGNEAFKKIKGTLWDAYDVVDGELKPIKNKEAVEKIQSKVTNKINTLAVRIDGNIQETDRAQIHQNAITQFFAMHRNFLISGIQERIKSKQFNYSTGQMEGGMYSDAYKFIKSRFSLDKINVITSLIADYNNLDELEKYNVRKVFMDLVNIGVWSVIISTLFVAAADDDPDDYFLQALAYASTRISFEFRTLYNPIEITNLFNSPSAAVSSLENFFNYIKLVFPGTYFYESNVFSPIKTGVYKGWPKILRNTVKLTPIKNILEATDVKGIRAKRNYLENQMMF